MKMGKFTTSMAMFNDKLLAYPRVTLDLNLVLASEVLVEPQSLLVELQFLLLCITTLPQ